MDHIKFTSQYLEIIEDTISAPEDSFDSILHALDNDTINELTRRLQSHMNTFTEDAITAADEAATNSLYSFHFGLSPHLNETLKYAPLYNDHVILQDIVYRTLMGNSKNSAEVRPSIAKYIKTL